MRVPEGAADAIGSARSTETIHIKLGRRGFASKESQAPRVGWNLRQAFRLLPLQVVFASATIQISIGITMQRFPIWDGSVTWLCGDFRRVRGLEGSWKSASCHSPYGRLYEFSGTSNFQNCSTSKQEFASFSRLLLASEPSPCEKQVLSSRHRAESAFRSAASVNRFAIFRMLPAERFQRMSDYRNAFRLQETNTTAYGTVSLIGRLSGEQLGWTARLSCGESVCWSNSSIDGFSIVWGSSVVWGESSGSQTTSVAINGEN